MAWNKWQDNSRDYPQNWGGNSTRKVPSHIAARVRKIAQQYRKDRVIIDGQWYLIDRNGWVTLA